MHFDAVLDFWFGTSDDAHFGEPRAVWFSKSDATDQQIRRQFGTTVEAALREELHAWTATSRGTLALIVMLDQFTRNIYRETVRAFAGDPAALRLASTMVDRGDDRKLRLVERWFAYMPFQHSEFLVDQHESLRLFRQLELDGLSEPLPWAVKHLEIIDRFGRFPHRNSIMGRVSTDAELEFLQSQGSRF
ncbi:MAG: DUF924 family protein [Burkholderiaceae bacterium]